MNIKKLRLRLKKWLALLTRQIRLYLFIISPRKRQHNLIFRNAIMFLQLQNLARYQDNNGDTAEAIITETNSYRYFTNLSLFCEHMNMNPIKILREYEDKTY